MIRRYRARPVDVDALHFLAGITTKREILEFCPFANVGTPNGELDTADIRWFAVSTSSSYVNVLDFNWLTRHGGVFEVLSNDDFVLAYEEIP